MPVTISPWRAGDGSVPALGRDRGPRSHGPDMLPEGIGSVTLVTDDPQWFAWQSIEHVWRERKFVYLTGSKGEGDGTAPSVSDYADLGSIATTRAAKCFTMVSLSVAVSFFWAPAAL